jgi:hypothetical protein
MKNEEKVFRKISSKNNSLSLLSKNARFFFEKVLDG